jgi:cobalt-precorrin 5A hydrolase/precorrin-3B C17-methyltransferase
MENLSGPAIFVLAESARETAEKLRASIPGAEIHGLSRRISAADVFFDNAAAHLNRLHRSGREIVGVCAAAILIRALAPALSEKTSEPGVVAVSEDGRFAVPLLGGHRGANRRAREIAGLLGGAAAVTTAGDVHFGAALDEPPEGYVLGEPEKAKAFTARLLAGEKVRIESGADWLREASLPVSADGALSIREEIRKTESGPETLVYYPRKVVIGVGCERGCAPDEVSGLVHRSLDSLGLDPRAAGLIVSIALKADEPALHLLAEEFGAPLRFFSAATLDQEAPRLANPSEVVFAETGCHGVAEGAVLAALGPGKALALEKQKSRRATCALGIREEGPWLEPHPGRPRGELFVIGLGPGDSGWRTAEAEDLIARSTDLVGYQLYIDLAGPLSRGKHLHPYALGEEEKRVRAALDLAANGRRVGLLCSGDPGIYAMASLVYELIDREDNPEWRGLHIQVSPGVSAFQAAAARAGAPMGHDFCAISLSDLMTPWEIIERRILAASEGDFNIAFYNPVSARRKTQLGRAREILLAHRPPETPVIVARNLGRPGEEIRVTALSELNAEGVDMLSVVLVGSSETRISPDGNSAPRVYTPRGYAPRGYAQKNIFGLGLKDGAGDDGGREEESGRN